MANQPLLRNGYRTLPNSANLTLNKSHYAVQGHSIHRFLYQSKALRNDFLLVNNTNLPLILHCFRDIADYWSNFR